MGGADPWVPDPGSPTWIPYPGIVEPTQDEGPQNEDPDPQPGDSPDPSSPVPRGGTGYGLNPNGAQPDPFGIVGVIIQEVTLHRLLGPCIENPGAGLPQEPGQLAQPPCLIDPTVNEEFRYYEWIVISSDQLTGGDSASGSLVDNFRFPETDADGLLQKQVGLAKFVPADKLGQPTSGSPNAEAIEYLPYGDDWEFGGGPVEGHPVSSGDFPHSKEKPDGWDDDFGGAAVRMPEHGIVMNWKMCKQMPECDSFFSFHAY